LTRDAATRDYPRFNRLSINTKALSVRVQNFRTDPIRSLAAATLHPLIGSNKRGELGDSHLDLRFNNELKEILDCFSRETLFWTFSPVV
jgi:hypothetical protein